MNEPQSSYRRILNLNKIREVADQLCAKDATHPDFMRQLEVIINARGYAIFYNYNAAVHQTGKLEIRKI